MTVIAKAVQGSTHTALRLILEREDGTFLDLTNMLSAGARIEDKDTGLARDATGTFSVVGDPTSGVLQWDYSSDDVASEGHFLVQVSVTYVGGTVEVSLPFAWRVYEKL